MILLTLLIFLTSQVNSSILQTCGKFSFNSGLIINGEETVRGEFPFLVALLKHQNQKFFCAATLIAEKHALTGIEKVFTLFFIKNNFLNNF
jgi:secreted trypsin-like serine protease